MISLAVLVMALLLMAPAASAAEAVTLRAKIDGRDISTGTERHPIALHPNQPADLEIEVTNGGSTEITVRTVRLEGRAVELTFFAYDTAVGLTVPARQTETRRISLDLAGVRGQATGLFAANLKLLDPQRHQVASRGLVVDVRGSAKSVYGLFAIGLVALTAVTALSTLRALARNQLSPNRWLRGTRFLTIGLGVGLVLVIALSAFRVFVPRTGRWLIIVAVCSAAGFAVGYLTPAPEEDDDEAIDARRLERLTRTVPAESE